MTGPERDVQERILAGIVNMKAAAIKPAHKTADRCPECDGKREIWPPSETDPIPCPACAPQMTDPTDEEVQCVARAIWDRQSWLSKSLSRHLAEIAINASRAFNREKATRRLLDIDIMESKTSPTMIDEARMPHDR